MRKTKKRPTNAITVTTYHELCQFIQAWQDGHLPLVILVGGPGVQKTVIVREAVSTTTVGWIEGNCTPYGLYYLAWKYRNQPLVIDDVDDLYSSSNAVRILKALCQTEPVKRLAWTNYFTTQTCKDIPEEFTTTSSLVIIANEWKTFNDNILAVEDRGYVLFFEPSAAEVHRRTATWFTDQEIFDFMGDHLHLITRPSMRHYVRALGLKNASMDWRKALLSQWISGPDLLVARLLREPFATEEDRARAFVNQGGGCRATFFNIKKRLEPAQEPPRLTLRNSTPPVAGRGESLRQYPRIHLRGRFPGR